ncbi:MAG: LVIVD repeat-containing protein [Ilyomonas sp.]
MKKELYPFVLLVILSAFCFISCTKDTVTEHYTFYRPVYKTKDEVKNNIKSNAAESLQQPGKLFIKGNYIFLNDIDKGIHVIDYSNPAQPRNAAFINIPGNRDLAVRGNYLYADCYTDLVTIDISNPSDVKLKQFINGVFPQRYYTNYTADTGRVIQEWVRVDTTITHKFDEKSYIDDRYILYNPAFFFSYSNSQQTPVNAPVNGIGGSMARFALLKDRMYTISDADLKVFNTTDASDPKYVKAVSLMQGSIETIFPYDDKLFIGSQTGMYIYDASNADSPVKLGEFNHVRTCDPVITDGKYAYVTLSGGGACAGFENELDILDISNLFNPYMINSYQLTNPKGLSKDGNLLFICDGADGLKVFNAADVKNLLQLTQVQGMSTYDVIAQNGIAIVVAEDGLYFIDYKNTSNIKMVSKISFAKQ